MKEIKIEIPDTLDEIEIKEWVIIKVERHLKDEKASQVQSIDDLIKNDLDAVKLANGIVEEPIPPK